MPCDGGGDGHDHEDGPPDPQLDPEKSPGFGVDPDGLADIEVSRPGVTIGEATPEELMASDTDPVEDHPQADLLDQLLDGDHVERRRAALALGETETPGDRVAETLAGVAQTDEDEDVRQFAVESLGKVGGEIAERGALAVTRDDDPWVRAEAVVTLDRLDRAAHAERMVEALDDDHHAVRRNALISLFKHRGQDAEDVLTDAVEDPSERVREWAAHMLAGIDGDAARETLRRVAVEDDSDVVRITAGNALDEDPARFRRSFRGALSEETASLPGESLLNRTPDL
ncbi:HEAT repeat-containing protein [Halomicrobium zhouii]|uniref:HEAT repeat-containing protein n=1 Tax=Halomicrobium zhouii TaxID=767519 RepID=A0A1I6K7Q4_9EURY|nr:HEAT repeat domain-containing protein [Halomicrobium zhouii]SFR87295.1 HEAT repeat-containing protein [Halomicrobium zhouii]